MKGYCKLDPPRLFKLSHQVLCISGISFENKSLVGYVEMTIHPLQSDLTTIRINSKQCNIYQINIDKKWNAEFSYFDPSLDVCQGNAIKRDIVYYQKCHLNSVLSVDPDLGNGEVIINLPPELLPQIATELKSFTVCVEFAIQNPKGGIHFVVPDLPGTMAERSAHFFTYGVENSSRLWFPCIDSFSELCTWKVEVTVSSDMTAVSCGDLVAVEYTEDTTEKTFNYFLSSPTAAPNIALAVGPFEILVDPKMHEVTHFGLPKMMPVLRHTTSYIYQAFEFYEELMSSRYPYSYYKQVFVDESFCDVATYATMSILSTNLLHPPNVIDQTVSTRHMMASAVAQQFYGSFITMQSWSDAWLTKGITGFLSYLFCKKTFGNNEYRYMVMTDLQEVCDYEQQIGFVILDPTKRDSNQAFSIRSPQTLSPRYADVMAKKARLVMRMLEIRIGTEMLLQVLNKLLALAYTASQQPFSMTSWANMTLSTQSFMKIIYTVTGKDIEHFIDLWVYQGGCARFTGNFVFNRKRNVVELEIKQDLNAPGALKFVGSLNVTIQELDGSFNHTFKIEENKTKFEITCHSKSRRNKKKKIPLMTGEEIDMDLSGMDSDSPVLWLRLDPDLNLLRSIQFEQPDYMWQYQLKYERCIVAQFEAIEALNKFATPASRAALTNTIELEQCYYRVRQEACFCLAKIANAMVTSWTGPPAMIAIFRKMFGSHSCPFIVRQNNFSNFHHYYLLKTIPQAMARLRDGHNLCLQDVSKFLLDLFKYNDNSRNKWSDNYFRAALIEALAASITPAVTNMSLISGQISTADSLSAEMKPIVEEVVRCLNLEKLMPSYRYTVTVSCLYAIRTFQRFGHLPNQSDVFKDYAQPGVFRDVRVASLTCLVDFIRGDLSGEHLKWVLDFIEEEKDPFLQYHAVTCLTQNPPFKRSESSALNIEPLVERLWTMMTAKFSEDSRLRCALAELYFILYGRQRPGCLPETTLLALKEKKSTEEAAGKELLNEPVVKTELTAAASTTTTTTSTTQLYDPFSSALSSGPSWNPELSGLFCSTPMASSSVLEPQQQQEENMDVDHVEQSVDLTMISGEQTVGAEESLETEVIETTVVEMDENVDVKIDLDQNHSPTAVLRKTDNDDDDVKENNDFDGGNNDDDDDKKASDDDGSSALPLSPFKASPSHRSAESTPYQSPGSGPPEDVVISLDNIIKTEPNLPTDIFATSPPQRILPPPHPSSSSSLPPTTTLSLSPPPHHSPSLSPQQPLTPTIKEFRRGPSVESLQLRDESSPPPRSPTSSPNNITDTDLPRTPTPFARTLSHDLEPHSPPPPPPPPPHPPLSHIPRRQLSLSLSHSESEDIEVGEEEIKTEMEMEIPPDDDNDDGDDHQSPKAPPTPTAMGSICSYPGSPQHSPPPPSPPPPPHQSPSPSPSPPPPPRQEEKVCISLDVKMEQEERMRSPSPSPSPPPPPAPPSPPPAPSMPMPVPSPPSPPRPLVAAPTASVITSSSGLKTVITGAMSGMGSTDSKDRHREDKDRSSSHKSKKKKKKNKHKHKHKHKHDKGDKDYEKEEKKKSKNRDKERLLLDTSSARQSWSNSPCVQDDGGSSSELEV